MFLFCLDLFPLKSHIQHLLMILYLDIESSFGLELLHVYHCKVLADQFIQVSRISENNLKSREILESWNSFGWKRYLKVICSTTPCHRKGHLALDQSLLQHDFGHCQWLGIHDSGNLFHCLTTLTMKSLFLRSNLNLFSFKIIIPCPAKPGPGIKSPSILRFFVTKLLDPVT